MLCLLVNDLRLVCAIKGYSFGKRVGSVDTLWLCHMSPLHPVTTAGAQQHLLTTHMPPSPSAALDTWGFLPKGPCCQLHAVVLSPDTGLQHF